LIMPTLFQTLVDASPTPTPPRTTIKISAQRLHLAAKGLRQEDYDDYKDDENEEEEEEEEEDDHHHHNKVNNKEDETTPPPIVTPPPPSAAKHQPPVQTPTRPRQSRRRQTPTPAPLPIQAAPSSNSSTKKRKVVTPARKATTKKKRAAPRTPINKRTTPAAAAAAAAATTDLPAAATADLPAAAAAAATTPPAAGTTDLPDLPDGSYETWEAFVDAGGYSISKSEARSVKAWVKSLDPVWISEQVKFHKGIVAMRSELDPTARDGWADVLPKPHSMNFDFCCLILMVATPSVPDTKILDVFGKLFKDNYVDSKWVMEQGQTKLAAILAPLGRQHDSAKYITAIAREWHSMPRDYRALLSHPGVGPKVALVTIYECFKDGQGAPCDVHMVRIFKALGWMPTMISLSDSWVGKETSQHELARAAIEGWFPKSFWSELNQTWAGLGQLFRSSEETTKMAQWVDRQTNDWNSTFRLSDLEKLTRIHGAYK
jgi:endonuclease III